MKPSNPRADLTEQPQRIITTWKAELKINERDARCVLFQGTMTPTHQEKKDINLTRSLNRHSSPLCKLNGKLVGRTRTIFGSCCRFCAVFFDLRPITQLGSISVQQEQSIIGVPAAVTYGGPIWSKVLLEQIPTIRSGLPLKGMAEGSLSLTGGTIKSKLIHQLLSTYILFLDPVYCVWQLEREPADIRQISLTCVIADWRPMFPAKPSVLLNA